MGGMRLHSRNARVKPSNSETGSSVWKEGAYMEGSFSMTASTPAQRPIPAPETMKDAGMPNAGAVQMHSMSTGTFK